MARVCTGCGVVVDGNGNLSINGVQTSTYPYTAQTTTPNDIFCDSTSNELWIKPWGTAWGYIASAIYNPGIPQQVTVGTDTTITGFSLTYTAVANRRYKATFNGSVFNGSASTAVVGLSIWQDTTKLDGTGNTLISSAYGNYSQSNIFTASAGSHTLSVKLGSSPAVNYVALNVSPSVPATLWLEDIGPA